MLHDKWLVVNCFIGMCLKAIRGNIEVDWFWAKWHGIMGPLVCHYYLCYANGKRGALEMALDIPGHLD